MKVTIQGSARSRKRLIARFYPETILEKTGRHILKELLSMELNN
jgi:hypothetical protein